MQRIYLIIATKQKLHIQGALQPFVGIEILVRISDPLLYYAEESPVCLPVTRGNARETHYNA